MADREIQKFRGDSILGEDFTPQERQILSDFLDEDASVDVIIPDDVDPNQLWDSFEVACRVARAINVATAKIKPILGRTLAVIKKYPEVYESRGYASFTDFVRRGVPELFKISRSEAFHCLKIAERLPSLTVGEFKEIGIAKLQVLSRLTHDGAKNRDRMVEAAKTSTICDMKKLEAEMHHYSESNEAIVAVTVMMRRETADMWTEFHSDPEIQAYCETKNPGEIFRRLMDEVAIEWRAQGRYLMGVEA